LALASAPLVAAEPAALPKQGAALLKTDIMAVFAHPDDETGVAGALAWYARGKGGVVANVYCTRGEGGGNMVGTQWGAALGVLREAELRDALNTIGVRYCFFLDRLDWAYTESLAATFQNWGREETLGKLVRLVRTLRPEVIVTMNPAPRPGQHGHHQAAAVLATEAFSAAADARRFPEQLTKEGLTVWQPRKLYYGGDSGGVLVRIAMDRSLPDGRTPGQVAALAGSNHRSQGFGNFANAPWLRRPQTLTLVKSCVPVTGLEEDDLLRGLPIPDAAATPIAFVAPSNPPPLELTFVPRPAVAEYLRWVKAQRIEHVAAKFQADLPLVAGQANVLRLELANRESTPLRGEIALAAPAGWVVAPPRQAVRAAGQTNVSFQFQVTPPAGSHQDVDLTAILTLPGAARQAVARVHLVPRATVARVSTAPAIDGTDRGWETIPALRVNPTDLAEGKVTGEADSSAVFHLAHDRRRLFVDVIVKDDVVVSNIAPNDIKGHWRSDSVEICLDPVGGAEHTMGCYKLGIFPFDSTGAVRGARDADARQGLVEETAPRTRLASARTPDGYRVQAAIPFEEIGFVYRPGKTLGFNLIIYDGDKRDAAPGENINKSRIAWSPRPGVQGRPEDWGRLELK